MINEEAVKNLSNLARIDLSSDEVASLKKDLENILNYVSELQNLSCNNIDVEDDLINVMRDDNDPHESGLYTEKLLESAPHVSEDYVAVKKILN